MRKAERLCFFSPWLFLAGLLLCPQLTAEVFRPEAETLFAMIGVEENASQEALTRTVRALLRQFHTDRGSEASRPHFHAVNDLKEILLDEKYRRLYRGFLNGARRRNTNLGTADQQLQLFAAFRQQLLTRHRTTDLPWETLVADFPGFYRSHPDTRYPSRTYGDVGGPQKPPTETETKSGPTVPPREQPHSARPEEPQTARPEEPRPKEAQPRQTSQEKAASAETSVAGKPGRRGCLGAVWKLAKLGAATTALAGAGGYLYFQADPEGFEQTRHEVEAWSRKRLKDGTRLWNRLSASGQEAWEEGVQRFRRFLDRQNTPPASEEPAPPVSPSPSAPPGAEVRENPATNSPAPTLPPKNSPSSREKQADQAVEDFGKRARDRLFRK